MRSKSGCIEFFKCSSVHWDSSGRACPKYIGIRRKPWCPCLSATRIPDWKWSSVRRYRGRTNCLGTHSGSNPDWEASPPPPCATRATKSSFRSIGPAGGGLQITVQCGLRRKDVPISEKDRLAAEVEDRWVDFQDGLSNKRRYPVEQFRAFWEAGKRYAELTKNDPLIHREVVAAINGLREFLEVERKRIPGTIIADADRLESLLFSGYDPYFEGG